MNEATIESLVRQLYGLGAIRRQIGQHALAELGSQGFTALASIHVHGPLRVSEVAEHLSVDLSVASRQVRALAAAGYVDRSADGRDRRAQLLTVTERGERALRESHRRMVAAFANALGDWSDDDLRVLTSGLERLRGSFAAEQPQTAAA